MHARQLKREGEHRLCIPECIRYCVLSALRFGVLLPIHRMTARRVCSISGIKSPRPRRLRPRRESPMARGPLLLFALTMLPLVSSLRLPVCSVHKGDSSSRRDFLVKAATAAAMAVFQLPSPAMASGRKAAVLVSDEEEAADEAAAKAERRARRKAERARRKELKAQRRAKRASRKESKAKKPKRGQKARAADEEESTSADAESSSSDSEEGS